MGPVLRDWGHKAKARWNQFYAIVLQEVLHLCAAKVALDFVTANVVKHVI